MAGADPLVRRPVNPSRLHVLPAARAADLEVRRSRPVILNPAIPAVPLAAGMLSAVRHSLIVDRDESVSS